MEVSTDGGGNWDEAVLGEAANDWSWRGWTYAWKAAVPGRCVLSCRARDARGNVQPVEPLWNVGGYANNVAQQVIVNVV